jgi:hypothetical protein
MKHVLSVLSMAIIAVACNNEPKTAEATDAKPTKEVATLTIPEDVPYKAMYTNWVPGDAANIKTILDMYKNWDDKKMAAVETIFADSVVFDDPSGRQSRVVRPHLLDSLTKWRNYSDTTYTDIITAISLHSPDKNEDWVCVWSMNHWKDKKGKLDSSFTNENWQLKGSKVVYLTALEQKAIKNSK